MGVLPEYVRAVCRQQTFVAASHATTGGWARDAVKVGDRVEVTFNPLHEIEHRGGALRTLTLIDTGQKLINYQVDVNQERPGLQ